MKTIAIFLVVLFVSNVVAATTPVKPGYIALTPATFGELGFKEDFTRSDTKSTNFAFYYPDEIDARVGRSVRIVIKGADGAIESESRSSINKSGGHIQLSFDSKHDVAVSVEYGCSFDLPKGCQGEREYGISSVASFITMDHAK